MRNEIDLLPMEFNVIVALDPDEEKTAGGIIIPTEKVERNRIEETEGTLIAASPLAFGYEEWPDGAYVPQLGDRVFFARYAGILVERGGKWVRVVKDKEIVAVVQPQLSEASRQVLQAA
jgi:co-chaperonin GroES (HSP10)